MLTFLSTLALILYVVGGWKLFEKAGRPGWLALIPIVSWIAALRICGKPSWWILFFIPPLTPVAHFLLCWMLADRFGKGLGYGLGMFFAPMFFIPLLAFSDARYLGPDGR